MEKLQTLSIAQNKKNTILNQLQELTTTELMGAMYPNLKTLASICPTMPVTTASVKRSFSHMKNIKSRLRNRLSEFSLSHLMRISSESPEQLSDNELEQMIDVWNRKHRRISV